MPISNKPHRKKVSYAVKGPMTRAALDFADRHGEYSHFWTNFHLLPNAEKQRIVIEMFNEGHVVSAKFSMFVPEGEDARQPFTIEFDQKDRLGEAHRLKINIESVAELRSRAKLYRRDATAYANVRKVGQKTRAIDKVL